MVKPERGRKRQKQKERGKKKAESYWESENMK